MSTTTREHGLNPSCKTIVVPLSRSVAQGRDGASKPLISVCSGCICGAQKEIGNRGLPFMTSKHKMEGGSSNTPNLLTNNMDIVDKVGKRVK